jgi:type IV secretory pathway TrbL component
VALTVGRPAAALPGVDAAELAHRAAAGGQAGRVAEGQGVVPGHRQHQAGRLVGLAPAQPGEGLALGREAGVEVQERGHVGRAEQQRPPILPASMGVGLPFQVTVLVHGLGL